VCIFVSIDQYFKKFDISHFCKEQNLEIYANKLETETTNLVILSLYRALSGYSLPVTYNLSYTVNFATRIQSD
jgi:hypothetical protein